jgi:hypothetical protein
MANVNSNKSNFKLQCIGHNWKGKQTWILSIQDEDKLDWFEVPFDLYLEDLSDLVNTLKAVSG